MSVVLIILAGLLLLAGLVGCILPVLPGPPLAYVALVFVSWARDWQAFDALFLVLAAAVVVAVQVLDFIVPAAGARRYGASRAGIWGSVAGMIAGMLFFPPLGLFLGAWLGALLGELLAGRRGSQAWRAAWGVFVGTVAGILLKLAVWGAIAWLVVAELVG